MRQYLLLLFFFKTYSVPLHFCQTITITIPTSTANRSVVNTPEIKPITTGTEPMKKETKIINYIERIVDVDKCTNIVC